MITKTYFKHFLCYIICVLFTINVVSAEMTDGGCIKGNIIQKSVNDTDLLRDSSGRLRENIIISSNVPANNGDNQSDMSIIADNDIKTAWISSFDYKQPYIQIDLGSIYLLSQISYLPFRGFEIDDESNWYYRSGFEILVSDRDDFSGNVYSLYTCNATNYTNCLPRDQILNIFPDNNICARFIRIVQKKHSVISAAEIEVKGYLQKDVYNEDLIHNDNYSENVKITSNVPNLSGVYNSDMSNVTDNDTKTAWISEFGVSNPYIQVDLGRKSQISLIKYLPFGGNSSNPDDDWYFRGGFDILASNDSNFENNVYKLYSNNGNSVDESLKRDEELNINIDWNLQVRYIRIQQSKWDVISAAEINVYGCDIENDMWIAETSIDNNGKSCASELYPLWIKTSDFVNEETLRNNVYLTDENSNVIDADVVLEKDYRTISIHSNDILVGKRYVLVVTDGVKNLSGLGVSPMQLSFYAESEIEYQTNLPVDASRITNVIGYSNNGYDSDSYLPYIELIYPKNIVSSPVVETYPPNGENYSNSVTIDENRVIFDYSRLDSDTEYVINFKGAVDLDGNSYDNISMRFKTGLVIPLAYVNGKRIVNIAYDKRMPDGQITGYTNGIIDEVNQAENGEKKEIMLGNDYEARALMAIGDNLNIIVKKDDGEVIANFIGDGIVSRNIKETVKNISIENNSDNLKELIIVSYQNITPVFDFYSLNNGNKITFKAYIEEKSSVSIIVADYGENGELKHVYVEDKCEVSDSVVKQYRGEIELDCEKNSNSKAFVWSGLGNMFPYMQPIENKHL